MATITTTTITTIKSPKSYTNYDLRTYPLYTHPAIHGFNVPPGVYLSSPPDQHEALPGRRLTPTPARLARRTLYLPSHGGTATHLPLYDFTTEYRRAVRAEPIGSSRFKTNFGLMRKPAGDGSGAGDVSYLVDFEPPEARGSPLCPASTHATVRRRMLYGGAEVGLTIPPPRPAAAAAAAAAQGVCSWEDGVHRGDGAAVACTITTGSTGAEVPLVVSYPLRPTESKFGSSRNPWFTFTVPSLFDGERTLQWQVHPVEHGLLRYTLVEIPKGQQRASGGDDDEKWWEDKGEKEMLMMMMEKEQKTNSTTRRSRRYSGDSDSNNNEKPPFSASERETEPLIRAIYHNVGLGFSLSQPFSEGALLLQGDLDPELEAIIVASLLGLLWWVRGEGAKPRRGSKGDASASRKSPKSERGSVVSRKRSVSVESVDEKRPSSTSSSPTKKGLFGKILRRMS